MIDLIVFASAIAIAKYISQRNPFLSPRSSSTDIEKDERSSRVKAGQSYIDQGYQSSIASTNTPIHQISRYIWSSCLLISLLLFALSILEAAPISWLVLFDRASLFTLWYRSLLWALSILLVFVHPAFVGVILGASLFVKKESDTGNTSSCPPSSPGRTSSSVDGRRRKRPLVICYNILRILLRFILVTICWRLVRKIVGRIIPYRITRTDAGARSNRKQYYSWCNFGVVLAALISLTLSFISLASVGSLVLHYDTVDNDGFISGDSEPIEENTIIQSRFSLKYMVSAITAFGMIVASILNGFGCASLPNTNLVGLFLKPTSLTVIAKVEEDYHYACKQLEEKYWMLADVTAQSSSSRQSSSYTPSKNKALDDKARIKQLRQLQDEVMFLENLVGDMKDDIDEMKQSQKLALEARTTLGRIRGILGVIFSIVLVIRVLLSARSFIYILEGSGDTADTSDSRDILTNILMWLLGRNIVSVEQYDLFKQGTSLLLAGALSITQVRAFFRVVGALGRKLSRACGASLPTCVTQKKTTSEVQTIGHGNNDVALLLSSFVMGCYFMACVTVVKMTLPLEYRSSFSEAVGLNFHSFNRKLLDIIFFGSACISAATLASLFGIKRSHSERYQLDSQLSMVSQQLA